MDFEMCVTYENNKDIVVHMSAMILTKYDKILYSRIYGLIKLYFWGQLFCEYWKADYGSLIS